MMSVHVPPGAGHSPLSVSMPLLGLFWIDILGRASVAALSFVSGYLLIHTAKKRGVFTFARKRARSLLLPMLKWNAIFVGIVIAAYLAGLTSSTAERLREGSWIEIFSMLTGAFGPTANISLAFLRDVFASSVLIFVFWPLVMRARWLVLGSVIILAFLDATWPVILRPSILLFMLAGAVLAESGCSLERIASKPVTVVLGATLFVLSFLISNVSETLDPLANLFMRTGLTVFVLIAALYLCKTAVGNLFIAIEPAIFLTYLAHVPLFAIFWLLWKRSIQDYYPVFFFMAPVAAIVVGVVVSRPRIRIMNRSLD